MAANPSNTGRSRSMTPSPIARPRSTNSPPMLSTARTSLLAPRRRQPRSSPHRAGLRRGRRRRGRPVGTPTKEKPRPGWPERSRHPWCGQGGDARVFGVLRRPIVTVEDDGSFGFSFAAPQRRGVDDTRTTARMLGETAASRKRPSCWSSTSSRRSSRSTPDPSDALLSGAARWPTPQGPCGAFNDQRAAGGAQRHQPAVSRLTSSPP